MPFTLFIGQYLWGRPFLDLWLGHCHSRVVPPQDPPPLSLPALRREARVAFAEGYHRGRQRGEKAVARTEAQEGRAPVRRQEAPRGAEVGHTPAVEEEEDEGHESPISPATRLGRENADAILRFGPRLDIEYLQRLLTRERGEEVEEDPRCAAHSS